MVVVCLHTEGWQGRVPSYTSLALQSLSAPSTRTPILGHVGAPWKRVAGQWHRPIGTGDQWGLRGLLFQEMPRGVKQGRLWFCSLVLASGSCVEYMFAWQQNASAMNL